MAQCLADLVGDSRTTTELTTSFATGVANLIGLSNVEKGVEVVVRAVSLLLSYERRAGGQIYFPVRSP